MKNILFLFVTLFVTKFSIGATPLIPVQFQGEWNETKGSCKEFSASIGPSEIYSPFNETSCIARSVSEVSENSLTGKFSCKTAQAADIKYPKSAKIYTLKLTPEGALSSSIFENGKPLIRCK